MACCTRNLSVQPACCGTCPAPWRSCWSPTALARPSRVSRHFRGRQLQQSPVLQCGAWQAHKCSQPSSRSLLCQKRFVLCTHNTTGLCQIYHSGATALARRAPAAALPRQHSSQHCCRAASSPSARQQGATLRGLQHLGIPKQGGRQHQSFIRQKTEENPKGMRLLHSRIPTRLAVSRGIQS